MAKCGNCGNKLGCSCKMRKASDGKQCCVNCVGNYNKILQQKKKQEPLQPTNTSPGVILNATAKQKE